MTFPPLQGVAREGQLSMWKQPQTSTKSIHETEETIEMTMTKRKLVVMCGLVLAISNLTAVAQNTIFNMVRSSTAVAAGCLPTASGRVTIHSIGIAETMHVEVTGLPRQGFRLLRIQLPNAPFGMSWYQGDIETDSNGRGIADFVGRFSIETFVVAPGSGPAPVVHATDASTNPATAPVHTYHLGLWFNNPADAAAVGCPNSVTPFNGDHTAGVQALSTRNFAATTGPLKRIQ